MGSGTIEHVSERGTRFSILLLSGRYAVCSLEEPFTIRKGDQIEWLAHLVGRAQLVNVSQAHGLMNVKVLASDCDAEEAALRVL
jgi:hypothetical protein